MKGLDFIENINKKIIILIVGIPLLLGILVAGFLIIRDSMEDRRINAREEQKMACDIADFKGETFNKDDCDLLFPELVESLDLSMDPLRDKDFQWTEEEVSRLWLEASAADIDYFTEANHKLVWDILKNAP